MVLALTIVGILIAAAGVVFTWRQLRDARREREATQALFERQKQEDDEWSAKYANVATTLSKVALCFVQGNANRPSGQGIVLLFPDPDFRTQIFSHLIQELVGPCRFIVRPFNVEQLRLKPMRDLISTVEARFEEYKEQEKDAAFLMGLLQHR